MVDVEQKEYKSFQLSSEGEGVAKDGSHEAVVFSYVPQSGGILQKELMVRYVLWCLHGYGRII